MDFVKFEVYLPEATLLPLREALNKEGLLGVGNYDMVTSWAPIHGSWRPLPGASPYDGVVGQLSVASEIKLEFRCPAEKTDLAKDIIRRLHPYEEPVINVLPLL